MNDDGKPDLSDAVIGLSQGHHEAVNRRRRIVVQCDAWGYTGKEMKQWLEDHFSFMDESGSEIDAIWLDIGEATYACYPSKVLQVSSDAGLKK